jgi:hypothetical protein
LAGAHATPREALQLIGAGATECDGIADLSGGDFLATADHHVGLLRNSEPITWTVQRLKKRANAQFPL